jgi:hypothetical protein
MAAPHVTLAAFRTYCEGKCPSLGVTSKYYIMRLNQFSASVYINNKALLEYKKIESHTPDEIKVSCWIASEQGKVWRS